ncbi:Ig-like domain-containing protein [Neisseria sp. 83E34]|uniref:Ig-like domain-containing protein n=2 Tax=unclassified Neisseria TaxID=2623750 RepID=UPI0006CE613F|nr:Ig-like domain-containing protein [Neisseria sp. 83E34]
MTHYKLNITHNGQTESITLPSDQPLSLPAQPDTVYQLLDEQGNLIAQPEVQFVNEDLWVHLNSNTNGLPDLILQNYQNIYPATNTGHLGALGVTSAEAVAPVAEQMAIGGTLTSFQTGLIGLGVAGATIAGLSIAKSSKDSNPKKQPEVNQPEVKQPEVKQPEVKQPEVKQPEVKQPEIKQPEIKQPEIKQPEIKQPEIKQPEIKQPEIKQPEIKQPEIKQPEIKQPEIKQPEIKQPEIKQPEIKQPEIKQPEIKQPEIKQPEVKQPEVNQPEVKQPEVNQPEVNQPEVNQPEVNQPEVNQPEVNQPEVNQPEVNQPEVNQPEVNQPEVNQPEVNQPEVNQPEVNQPEVNQPEVNQPEVNQPEVNQPETQAPISATVTINPIAHQDVINAKSAKGNILVSGSISSNQDIANADVVLYLNGKAYPAIVNASAFSVEINGKAFENANIISAVATVHDNSGNSTKAMSERAYSYDVEAPEALIRMNRMSDNSTINIATKKETYTLSGPLKIGEDSVKENVTVKINGQSYPAKINGLTWSLETTGEVLAFAEGAQSLQVILQTEDAAGNINTASMQYVYLVDTVIEQPVITLNPIAADNIINAAEVQSNILVSGSVEHANEGDTVTLTAGTYRSTTTVQNGKFSLEIEGSVLAASDSISARIEISDDVGNTASAVTTQNYTLDTEIDTPVITFNAIAEDNIINLAESKTENTLLSGTVEHAKENDEIIITVGEAVYKGVISNGQFAVAVSTKTLLNHGKVSASVTTTDEALNSATGHAERAYTIDTEYTPTISLNTIAGDNVLNIAESQNTVTVTGTVTDVADDENIVVSCGCESCGSVKWIDILTKVKNGGFSVDFEGSQLSKSGYTLVKASVTSRDAAGNTATVESTRSYTKDLTAPEVNVSINEIAGDDVLTKAKQAQEHHSISGTINGLQNGETVNQVIVQVGNQRYNAVVAGNTYSADIPSSELAAATRVDVSATVTDAAGNSTTAENNRPYKVGKAAPVITLDMVAEDNFINKAESDNGSFTLSGSVENVENGTEVTLQSGFNELKANVENGTFSITADRTFLGLANNVNNVVKTLVARISVPDDYGVNQTYTASQDYTIDLTNNTTITLHSLTGDNILNAAEMEQPYVTVSGSVTDGAPGSLVTIKIGKATYTAEVQADGSYSVDAEIAQIAPGGREGKYGISASVERVDAAGNTGNGNATFTRTFSVNKSAPNGQVAFDPITGDNVINRSEAAEPTLRITGKIKGLQEGDDVTSVTINVGNNEYTAKTTGSSFNVDIPADILAANDRVSGRAELKDAGGSTSSAAEGTQNYTYQTTPPSVNITVESINAGKALNTRSLSENVVLTGSLVLGDTVVRGTEKVTIRIDGTDYAAQVSNNTWTLTLPATTLAKTDGIHNVTASVTAADKYGNAASHNTTHTYEVDTVAPAPSITLNALANDNVLEQDAQDRVVLAGRVDGNFKENDTVVITVNGIQEKTTVDSSGVFSITVDAAQLTGAEKPVITAAITTADNAGNSASAQTALTYSVKKGDIDIKLNLITGDDLINVTEAKQDITISGSVSGSAAEENQTVELLINGETIRAQVQNNLTFSTTVAAEKLIANPGHIIKASISNGADASAKTSRSYEVAPEAAASINITGIDADFNIDVAQAFSNTRIGGVIELEGAFAKGMNKERIRQITVNIGDKTYTAGVKEDRSFFLDIPTKDLAKLNGKALNFKVEADPQLFNVEQTGNNTYRISNLARFEPVRVKEIKFDSPYINKDPENNSYVVSGAKDSAVIINGTVGGTAKSGDTVTLEVGGKVYQTEVDSNGKNFSVEVLASDLAADKDRTVKAVLNTNDSSGKAISVSDSEHYAVLNQVSGQLSDRHTKPASVNSDHTSPGYNFPYFIQKTGNINGKSYNIPLGGQNDGPTVLKYHFLTLDEISTLPENHNRYVDRATMTSYSTELQEIVRNAYKEISAVTNIEFVEVGTKAEANTNYYMGNLMSGFEGASAIAYNGGLIAWNSRHNYMSWGKDFLHYTVLHEVTHTLGMIHTSGGFTGDYAVEENSEFSFMSYNAYANNNFFIGKGQLRTYDLAYLHYTAGMNKTVRTGNDIYTFKNYNMYSQDSDRYIWDAGGVDTFDASQEKAGVNVNLTPGSWIYVGDNLSKTFSVQSAATHNMRSYFNLGQDASITGNSGANVKLNTYTEGQAFIGYGTQIENLIGSQHNDVLTGNSADNNIYGGAGNDTIRGGAGNDYLDGGEGEDTLIGGEGNDSYVIDNASDTIQEAQNQGEDHVYSSITYTLGEHLENLTLIGSNSINGTGNAQANILRGNGSDNELNGMEGDDRIIGGGGNDTLTGGEGNDTFVFDTALDGSVTTIKDFLQGDDTIELSSAIFGDLKTTLSEFSDYISYQSQTGYLYYDSDGKGKADAIHFATLSPDLTINESHFDIV